MNLRHRLALLLLGPFGISCSTGWQTGVVPSLSASKSAQTPLTLDSLAVAYSQSQAYALADSTAPAHLQNLSARGKVGPDQQLITGFSVRGSAPASLLIRGAGPSLARFGVSDALPDPRLEIFNAAGKSLQTIEEWSTDSKVSDASVQAGAFGFTTGSHDTATVLDSSGGTAVLTSASGKSGIALAEIYDLGKTGSALANLSIRGITGPGDAALIGGLVVSGAGTTQLLFRGIGPTLEKFQVNSAIQRPRLTVYDSNGAVLGTSGSWGGKSILRSLFSQTGAFEIADDSADSALVLNLTAGAYTVQLTDMNEGAGAALLEIYAVENPVTIPVETPEPIPTPTATQLPRESARLISMDPFNSSLFHDYPLAADVMTGAANGKSILGLRYSSNSRGQAGILNSARYGCKRLGYSDAAGQTLETISNGQYIVFYDQEIAGYPGTRAGDYATIYLSRHTAVTSISCYNDDPSTPIEPRLDDVSFTWDSDRSILRDHEPLLAQVLESAPGAADTYRMKFSRNSRGQAGILESARFACRKLGYSDASWYELTDVRAYDFDVFRNGILTFQKLPFNGYPAVSGLKCYRD